MIHGLRKETFDESRFFWLTDEQFARIEPHLPTDTRGKPRVDDRRVISGIVHVLKSGGKGGRKIRQSGDQEADEQLKSMR